MPWPLLVTLGLGLVLLTIGVLGFRQERRRLSNAACGIAGLGLTLLAGLVLWADFGSFLPQIPLVLLVGILLLLVLGYPVLMIFLILNGLTMAKRERRTAGNLLSLAAGLLMLAGPPLLAGFSSLFGDGDISIVVQTLIGLLVYGLASYLGFCFLAFLVAAVAYRRVPRRFDPAYVIVLGSGLIGSRVPALLARRLDKAIQVAAPRGSRPAPILIPSGGKGPDEDVAEGRAMADYLIDHGIPEERIRVEDRAASTVQNLRFSRELMDDPDAPVVVVTTSYHVFRAALLTNRLGLVARVTGAPVASYYVPSAFLREFVAVMREHLRLNLILATCWILTLGFGAFYLLAM